jgi:hypothetical protein
VILQRGQNLFASIPACQLLVFARSRMRDSKKVNTSANRSRVGRLGVVRRSIASTTVTATAAIASPAVVPATAISVVSMVSVSERTVVAARGATSADSPATTTEAKDDACDHYHHYYDYNRQKSTHQTSPSTDFPTSWLQSTFEHSAVTTHRLYTSLVCRSGRFANRACRPIPWTNPDATDCDADRLVCRSTNA